MSHPDGPRTGRPPSIAANGMVSTPHHLATSAGLHALYKGGSAVDAAIAANAVLTVVYPHMAGLGGDGFWLINGPATDGVEALEASGPSARLATADYYREKGATDRIPDRGPLAALTVPGAVDGWRLAHERHGKLPWADLFAHAIRYAQDGMAITRSLADWLAADEAILSEYETTARTFLPDGRPAREGKKLVQAALAASLQDIASRGARGGFYEGDLAGRMTRALEQAGSPLRAEDFASYQARWVDPITTRYRDHDVWQLPPSTQGFAALQLLNLLEGFDFSEIREGSADYYHLLVEAVKIAFADRDEWLTDPAFVEIPLKRLLATDYADERRGLIDIGRALDETSIQPGIRFSESDRMARPGGDTVYFSAADAEGLVVSVIQSPYYDFGSAFIAGDSGIIMQNRGSFFSLDERHANFLEPGKKTFHTIIPAMLTRDGETVMAYGTMGGEGQPQTQAAMLTRMLDYGFDVQQAIEAPRWLMGRTWGTDTSSLTLESRIGDETVRELKLRGQLVSMVGAWDGTLGHAQAIFVNQETGFYEGGADPRGDGSAAGW